MDVRYVDVRALTTRMNDRRDSQSKDVLFFGPFSLFAAQRLLKKADEPIPLGGRALDILIALAERPGEVVTHKELISTVWPDVTVEEANLRFQMAALRKALGDGRDGARYLSNVAGRGYCFVAPVTRSTAARTVPVTGIATTERVQKLPPRLTVAMTLFERWRSNSRCGASSASSVPAGSEKLP
jgi:DNA-binding winged helix-turn-helix (wHTH) protein